MKYIIEVEDECTDGLYRAKGFKTLVFDEAGLKKLEPVSDALQHGYDEGYQDGLNDAWGCAGKILTMEPKERENCFGTSDLGTNCGRGIITHSGCQYCLAKIKEYEEEQKKAEAEIKVGDEVYFSDKNHTRVVFSIVYENVEEPRVLQFTESGKYVVDKISDLHKTGRHFSQIEEVLKQMKGE